MRGKAPSRRKPPPLLSEDDFARVWAQSRSGPKTFPMVRAVMVEGKRQIDVAREVGVTKAWVNEAVLRFRALVVEVDRATLPPDWKRDTVVLPLELWPVVRKLEREARAELIKKKRG